MPIYEYDCPECGRFEVIQKFGERPLRECPECAKSGKKNKISKLVSASSFHLKGTGWYKTDYASAGSSGSQVTKSKGTNDKATNKDDKACAAKPETVVAASEKKADGCVCDA